MQYRSLNEHPVELRSDGDSQIISGRAATFNSLSHDLGGFRERINQKAFDRTLKEIADGKRHVSARVQHEGGLSTVGTTANGTLRLRKVADGLDYELVAMPDTQAGRDLVTLVKGGYISKSSFAFRIPDKQNGMRWDYSTNPPTVELLDVDLVDVAPVDGPAYEATSVSARAEMFTSLRDASQRVEINILDEIVPTWLSRHMGDTVSSGKVIEALNAVPDAKSIEVYINSPGGDVYESLAIYNTLRDHPAPVNVHVRGLAASGASIIAMAGDNITMGEGSLMMIHRAMTIAAGNAGVMRDTANFLDKIDAQLGGIYTARTGIDGKQVQKMMADETWMSADEAITNGFATGKLGVADEINVQRCRDFGFKRIPEHLGGLGDIMKRSDVTADDIIDMMSRELQKTREISTS